MRTIVVLALFGLLLLVLIVRFGTHGTLSAHAPSSSSQIYIHGTPVCVTNEDETIVARVGECGNDESGRRYLPDGRGPSSPDRAPFHGRPRMELPPGHPPVDEEMFPERRKPVLISASSADPRER